MNKVILIGRLTRDPELRHTPNGASVCQFTIAVDRIQVDQNGQRQADFIPVVVWNRQAENVSKYITKGRLVAVEGRIQTRNYDNNEGRRVYVTEVIANNVQFLESKNASSNNYNVNNNNIPVDNNFSSDGIMDTVFDEQPISSVDVEKDPFESFGETVTISDNDLPF